MIVVSSLSSRSRSTAVETAYHPVSGKPEVHAYTESITESPQPEKKKNKRRWPLSWHTLSHVFGLLWMAPIIALLVLNFKQHVIGASIWCPKEKCNAEAYGDAANAIAKANKLDREDHDILGALQFVAKALEVWFIAVATALLYDVALYLAKQEGGLPISYLLTHLEFGDIRNLLNRLMWTSPITHDNLIPTHKPAGTWKLYMFAGLASFLTILANLMGPSTAVLVLPTLQWVDTDKTPAQRFISFKAQDAPTAPALPGCNSTQLEGRNYTCTSALYGASMDSWFAQVQSTLAQDRQVYGGLNFAITQESSVDFTANLSTPGDLIWIPTRQVLRDLSEDALLLGHQLFGGEANQTDEIRAAKNTKHTSFNNSLETILQREGPSIGTQFDCQLGNVTVKVLAGDRRVRCFQNYTTDQNTNYTKCYQEGTGWGGPSAFAQFTLGGESFPSNESSVEIFSSNKATYFNGTDDFGSGIEKCLGENIDCDWDEIFEAKVEPQLANSTVNPLVIEYLSPKAVGNKRLYCESITYNAFPTYSVDTSSSANPLHLANMNDLPSETKKSFNKTTLAVNPDWVLAAWSTANNGTIDDSRLIGKELARVIADIYSSPPSPEIFYQNDGFVLFYLYTLTQTLSIINYDYSNDTSPLSSNAAEEAQPVFKRWATLRVWAYGLRDRTSKLGLVVAVLGCICVILRAVLALALRIRHEYSTVELLAAALEHQPTHEFDHLSDESQMAKVRYILEDGQGKPRLVSERVYNGGA